MAAGGWVVHTGQRLENLVEGTVAIDFVLKEQVSEVRMDHVRWAALENRNRE
jgi:hypothetical protein